MKSGHNRLKNDGDGSGERRFFSFAILNNEWFELKRETTTKIKVEIQDSPGNSVLFICIGIQIRQELSFNCE